MTRIKKSKLNQLSYGSNLIANLFFIIVVVLCLAPLMLVLAISVTDEYELLVEGYSFIPDTFSLKAYSYVIAAGDAIVRAYSVSIFVTVFGTILSLLFITMYAYPLSRPNFKYKNQFAFFAYFTMIFGGGLVPWYIVYTQLVPISDSIWILIVPYLINAWYVLIMRTFIKTTVHESMIESALIDGAGDFRTFFQIVMPLCKPGLATIGLFCCLNYWNDYWLPLVFVKDQELYNIQYYMYQILTSIQFLTQSSSFSQSTQAVADLPSEGARMAIAVLSIGPVILAYPFFQNYLVQGLTIGSVKG